MKNRVIALGFFDGVHLGHAALLEKTVALAAQYGAEPAVLTFKSHPGKMTGKANAGLINSAEERTELIGRLFGIKDVILWDFDSNLMRMPWRDFLTRVVNELGAVHFIAGYDYRFGYKGEGDAEKLKEFAKEIGIGADIVEPVEIGGQVVSSTLIRGLISQGDVERASGFLGHPHCMISTVEPGKQLGRTMGLPTVNQHFSRDTLLPAFGVYASKVYINGKDYVSVTNIGVRPTVTDEKIPKAETHIIDYSGDLYGKEVYTELYKFIRGEQRFQSVDELAEQINRDIDNVKAYFKR